MKQNIIAISLLALAFAVTSCENENINPLDYNGGSKTDTVYVSNDVKTAIASYPSGAIVWSRDTTLTESVEIPEGRSLYIEPGVTVTCSSTAKVPVEIVPLGNLYILGTAEKPVTITSDTKKPADWGGIICGQNSEEVVINHAVIEYAGATPTESSVSFQNQLFKTEIDGGVPAFNFCNVNGRFVVANSIFRNNYNDQTYIQGGNGIFTRNIFADSGNAADGGEAINVKAGCNIDASYNLIYNACTNAFKLSNSGVDETHLASQLRIFNNTMVDCGWRRAKNKKGGNIWLEKKVAAVMVNNLSVDNRFGMRQNKKDKADEANSTLVPNYFYCSTQTGVDQLKGDKMDMYLDGNTYSTTAGEGNPLFVNFAQNPKMDINCQVDDQEQGAPLAYSSNWDFHLQAGSPALTGGVTALATNFPQGLIFVGIYSVNYTDLSAKQAYYFTAGQPAQYFGAFGTK